MTHLNYLMARQKHDELVDRAERARQIADGGLLRRDRRVLDRVITALLRRDYRSNRRAPGLDTDAGVGMTIVLRIAGPTDSRAVAHLAGLDSASVPAEPVLIAEADGMIRAALSLSDGAMIADPFHHTAAPRQLLRARAAQLRGDGGPRRRVKVVERGTGRPVASIDCPKSTARGF